MVGFQSTAYSVFEFEETLTVTAILIAGLLERNVSVDFRTSPGSATGSYR